MNPLIDVSRRHSYFGHAGVGLTQATRIRTQKGLVSQGKFRLLNCQYRVKWESMLGNQRPVIALLVFSVLCPESHTSEIAGLAHSRFTLDKQIMLMTSLYCNGPLFLNSPSPVLFKEQLSISEWLDSGNLNFHLCIFCALQFFHEEYYVSKCIISV